MKKKINKSKQESILQEVGGMVTKKVFVFCLKKVTLLSTSKPNRI